MSQIILSIDLLDQWVPKVSQTLYLLERGGCPYDPKNSSPPSKTNDSLLSETISGGRRRGAPILGWALKNSCRGHAVVLNAGQALLWAKLYLRSIDLPESGGCPYDPKNSIPPSKTHESPSETISGGR